ncbi:MAG: sulfotransferase family protein [Candidatus Poribacteria bacterium]|nr:sulfotransferase family protein [Candidatus Poribacteria bacterium]MDP6748543.1 sulfotransferase family protein [Candidatus Poribacteria bacterium]MDP6996660.1 sulfotransferase family protein [Candidatus Poribacteria bacterium]
MTKGNLSSQDSTHRVCLWSGPRNVSTALMYAFAQRNDTRVIDEPLYGHYLQVSGADHPGSDEVIATMETDGQKVIQEVILGECNRPILFMKQMAHHLVKIDLGFLAQTINVLLIRDPFDVLRSLINQIPKPALHDTGIGIQTDLLYRFQELGQDLLVLDSTYLLKDPVGVLSRLCQRIGIPFQESMLSWPAGGRPEDGAWAPYWYHNVHKSTGFQPYRPKIDPFPLRLEGLLAECRPLYETLKSHAIV